MATLKLRLSQSGAWIGVGGMFIALFLYAYTAIALPSALHSVGLPLAWLILLAVACAGFPRHPYRSLATSVIALAVWFAVMLAR